MHLHAESNFRLESGVVLPTAVTAYRTLGALNAAGDNAVLVLHGYTTGPSMLDEGAHVAEGSWSGLIGPGRAIDTDRHYVICPNMLGSSYGSTGPRSTDPATGRGYGGAFPDIGMAGIVALQRRLLGALGVRRLAAVAGPSFGGYQAYQWAVDFPAMVDRVIVAVSAPWHPASCGNSADVLRTLSADPDWNGGRYVDVPGAMHATMTRLRRATLLAYGVDAELQPRFPDPEQRSAEMQRIAEAWAQDFDAGSLLTLMRAAENFDLRSRLGEIRAPLLLVNSRSDSAFSPTLMESVAPVLDAARLDWRYLELDSDKGHVASGADWALWSDVLAAFMRDIPIDASRCTAVARPSPAGSDVRV